MCTWRNRIGRNNIQFPGASGDAGGRTELGMYEDILGGYAKPGYPRAKRGTLPFGLLDRPGAQDHLLSAPAPFARTHDKILTVRRMAATLLCNTRENATW
jgi:hypothetical protein